MLKLNKEYVAFLNKNAPDMVKYISDSSIDENKISNFLDDFYDWIEENGFDDEGYYNSLGNAAQKIYDFVVSNS